MIDKSAEAERRRKEDCQVNIEENKELNARDFAQWIS